jgi:hypothetical protein
MSRLPYFGLDFWVVRSEMLAVMLFEDPPAVASWHHQGLRIGFEVVFFRRVPSGFQIEATTAGLQDESAWVVRCQLDLDPVWKTRRARIQLTSESGVTERLVQADGEGHWMIDGVEARHLSGCIDIDLESSAMTNALPVHRLGLAVGQQKSVPACYVRIDALNIERLEQSYLRIEEAGWGQRFAYEAPIFDFHCELVYDRAGLVLEYPGIAVRAG